MRGVLNISEAFSLALHSAALVAAEGEGGRATARSLAATLGASEAHLSKVLQKLVRAGILRSTRGPGGGFSLARPGGDVSLMEVYESVEGPFRPADCLAAARVCRGEECVFGSLLEKVNGGFRDYLETTTVEDIGKIPGRGGGIDKKDRADRRGEM